MRYHENVNIITNTSQLAQASRQPPQAQEQIPALIISSSRLDDHNGALVVQATKQH
jgi:hypothetical protein